MTTDNFIPKDSVIPSAQDFHFLKTAGLALIEKLGSKFWTDYNHHDPGITIMDVLIYAITELGYRSEFAIQDLLASKDGTIQNKTFFSAAQILTNAPLTVLDYRKLLIDIEGISNAWIVPFTKELGLDNYPIPHPQEVPIFYDVKADQLSVKDKNIALESLSPLQIRGLNKVWIELDDDPILGDLNLLEIETGFWHKKNWVAVKAVPVIKDWNDEKSMLFKRMNTPAKIIIENITEHNNALLIQVNRYTHPDQKIKIWIYPNDSKELTIAKDYLDTEITICAIIDLFAQKQQKIASSINTVYNKLQQNRNFTDDYLSIAIIQMVRIAVCVDVKIMPDADIAMVYALINIAIENIINPKIKFYTLKELVDEGIPSEAIFSGPRLKHGFIKDADVHSSRLPTAIYASDIIASIMEIEGVVAVENILMSAYDHNNIQIDSAKNQPWVLPLSGIEKAVFDKSRSKILLFNNKVPFLLSEQQEQITEQQILMLKNNIKYQKLNNTQNDFDPPKGTFYELDNYYSIQNDFPATYKVGKNEVSDQDTPLRKAQAKQLKGYLFFYEQIIADYFSQIYNAKHLLDINTINQTYFSTDLTKITEDAQHLFYKDIIADSISSLFEHSDTQDNISLQESKIQYYKRRQKALNHLLARFSESFNEYVFTMYQLSQGSFGITLDQEAIIQSKQNFLAIYPEISSNRGIGINYQAFLQPSDFLNTTLNGGFEKRTARLLGIEQLSLRDIVTEPALQKQWTVEIGNTSENYVFKIIDPETALEDKWIWSQQHFLENDNYQIVKNGTKFYCYLQRGIQRIARLDQSFNSLDAANTALHNMIKVLNAYYENFYCVEHILLRPLSSAFIDNDCLLPTCLDDNCGPISLADPYTAKATIVLPGYLLRFKSITFRKFAESVFRKEAPAHVLLKICWVGYEDMLLFQKAYKNWIFIYNKFKASIQNQKQTKSLALQYSKALQHLIEALSALNTIYPEGTLYDCQISSSTDNPIILGQTSLGTLKNN